MIKNVIFDCSDTLVHFELNKATANWLGGDDEGAARIHTLTYGHPALARYCMGTLDYETARDTVLEDVDMADREICKRHMEERADHYETIDGIPELLRALKEGGYRLYILSDFPEYFEKLYQRFDYFKLFDGTCVSYEAHCGKRDGMIFTVITDRFDLDPTECVFIDDTLRNVKMAKTFGMKAIQFKDTADTIAHLKDLGLEF